MGAGVGLADGEGVGDTVGIGVVEIPGMGLGQFIPSLKFVNSDGIR